MNWRNSIIKTLIKRDGILCQICKQQFTDIAPMEIDHKIPRNCGGEDIVDNLQLVHSICNRKKAKLKVNDMFKLEIKVNSFESEIDIIRLKKIKEALLKGKLLEETALILGSTRRIIKYQIDKYNLDYRNPQKWLF